MNKKIKYQNLLFYIAFSIIVISRLLYASSISNLDNNIRNGLYIISSLMFILKILFDKHNLKSLLGITIIGLINIFLIIKGLPLYIFTTYLALVSFKNINIKTIIKIDLTLKLLFLAAHSLLFGLDYIFGIDLISNNFIESNKGIAYTLYFKNPNNTSALFTWMIFDILYLKKENKAIHYLIFLLVTFLVYHVTKCRTSVLLYIVYVLLQTIKNKKIINFISKNIYIILFIVSIILISLSTKNYELFVLFNHYLSGRLSMPLSILVENGVTFLPKDNILINYNVPIDNFYFKCLISYGTSTLILFGIPALFINKTNFSKEKIFYIIGIISLFFECVIIDVGYAVPLLFVSYMYYKAGDSYEE